MVREVGGHSGCASGDVRSGTPLLKAMETAAAADPDAVKLWEEHQPQHRIDMADFAATLAAKTTLRCDDHTVTEALWALTSDAYIRPVHEAGWQIEKFQTWLAGLAPAGNVVRAGHPARSSRGDALHHDHSCCCAWPI